MNQNRNNQERDDNYQNVGRGARNFPNRTAAPPAARAHANLNPNYQNPADLIHNYNRPRQQQEPEENIYERLDNDDDDEHNAQAARNEVPLQNNQGNVDNHTYERIGDRPSACRAGPQAPRGYKYHLLNFSAVNALNDADARNINQYDQPRHIYLDSSRLGGSQFCTSRLGRLGRNCFSTENIAYASSRRSVYPLGHNCTCPFCRHLYSRYFCHQCHSLHNKLRYQETNNMSTSGGNSRHYIYQLSRNCRCPFCGGESLYAKFPTNSGRMNDNIRKDCHCRNPANCICRNKVLSNSNSTMQISRYLDWINRVGTSVNNPLYATIHIGRIDRPCASGTNNGNAGNSSSSADQNNSSPSQQQQQQQQPPPNEPSTSSSTSSNIRSIFAPGNPSTSSAASVCAINRSVERQHICDDSCIRNQSGNIAGVCQFLSQCERAECNHGRLSVHWWFINKWLPLWNAHNPERHVDAAPVEEEPQEHHESDSDDP